MRNESPQLYCTVRRIRNEFAIETIRALTQRIENDPVRVAGRIGSVIQL